MLSIINKNQQAEAAADALCADYIVHIMHGRHLMGDSLSALSVKELKQLENRLERGITRIRSKKGRMLLDEIEYLQKKKIEMENETVYLCTKIVEIERMEQANMVPGQEMNAIQVLASRNFFPPNMLEGGNFY
ncbi:agamous-like MADS-box protein AGL11, partial [Punica granatum]|uniref:Agamous-like MADS-box protein AGL11 n=1 Tax=Punica granatum TaxID=22663 RepID=A0A6P8DF77_PUNGR